MSSGRILFRYLFKEMLVPFGASLFVFTGILFLFRILKLIDLVVNRNVPAKDIILLFSFVIPKFLEIAIPMALLLSIIFAFGRLSADSELVVLRASGISLKTLVRPVLAFAGLMVLVTLMMSFWIRPLANYNLGLGLFEIARTRASVGLIAGTFNEIGPLTIYASEIDNKSGNLKDVILSDRQDPQHPRDFVAQHGNISSDENARTLQVQLFEGSIHEGQGLDYTVTYYPVSNIVLNQDELLYDETVSREGKKSDEMTFGELSSAVSATEQRNPEPHSKLSFQLARYLVEFHRRFTLPFSCLAVAVVAMALGVQPSRSGQSWGQALNILVGVLVIVIYYLLSAFAGALGEQELAPPWLVMWVPNILFTALAVFLFKRLESEQWLAVSQALGEFFTNLQKRLSILLKTSEPETTEETP